MADCACAVVMQQRCAAMKLACPLGEPSIICGRKLAVAWSARAEGPGTTPVTDGEIEAGTLGLPDGTPAAPDDKRTPGLELTF